MWSRLWLKRVAGRKEEVEGPGSMCPGVLPSGDQGPPFPVPEHFRPGSWDPYGETGEEGSGAAEELIGLW